MRVTHECDLSKKVLLVCLPYNDKWVLEIYAYLICACGVSVSDYMASLVPRRGGNNDVSTGFQNPLHRLFNCLSHFTRSTRMLAPAPPEDPPPKPWKSGYGSY